MPGAWPMLYPGGFVTLVAILFSTLVLVGITMVATRIMGRNAGWLAAAVLAGLTFAVGLRIP